MNTATQNKVIIIRERVVQNRWDLKIKKATMAYHEKSVSQ